MRRATQPQPTAGRRAQLVALVCVAAQLAAATHLVLVRHAACPEHGDLLHGDVERGPRAVVELPDRTAALRAASPEESHEHDHCSVPSERRKQAPAAASYVLAAAEAAPVTSAPSSVRVQRGVAPFRLAPKQSPPAV